MKNIILLLISISYFLYFYVNPNNLLFQNIEENITYGKEILSYFNAIVVIFLTISIIGLINNVIKKYLRLYFSKTKNKYDDIIGEFIIKFINISKYIIALYVGMEYMIIPEKLQVIIDKFFNVSFILVLILLTTSLVSSIFEILQNKGTETKLKKQIFPMLNKMVNAFIWVIGSITIIGNLGYNIGALITGAGVGGLAIALAAKTSIANIFGAISVFINKPFKIGDLITISGQTGTVKNIGLTYLTLIDKTGYKILIPNENIISSSVENISIRENRRTDFAIGVIYDTSLESLKSGVSIIENILEKYKKEETIKSYRVNFDSFGDFSLNINITYFSLLNEDYLEYIKQKEEINLEIKKMFEKEKIEMAFPTQEIILKK